MVTFNYQGRDARGKKVAGKVQASDVGGALTFLKQKKITPIKIEPISEKKKPFDFLFKARGNVRDYELLNFFREVATLLEAGVPIVDILRKLAQSTSSKKLADAILGIANDIAAGQNMALAMRAYPEIFPALFTNVVEVGESTGNLTEVFARLADYLEMKIVNRQRITSTLRYPIMVVVSVFIAIVIMGIFVIPKFAQVFSQFHTRLPTPTLFLIAISNFLVQQWPFLLVFLIIMIFLVPRILKVPAIKLFWDRWVIAIPILGSLQKRIILTQFAWTYSLILRSGISVTKGLTLAAGATGNAFFNRKILEIRDNVDKGESFSQAVLRSNLFLPSVLEMIAVGEESGKLDDILSQVARYYEREIDYDIKKINQLMEPFLLMVVAVMVVILALGVYLPVWDLISAVRSGAGY
jgi:MSHA biogenesis protein MshG